MGGSIYFMLVADDDPEVVTSVSSSLERLSHKFRDRICVFPASCGTEVLNILGEHRIDVIFLDYYFKGGMSGGDIVDIIDDPFKQKLIILMSGRPKCEIEGTVIRGHKHLGGRFRFLRKPIDDLELEAKYLEIEQFFSSRPYPFPLAYAHDALLANSTALGQLTAMKDLIELTAKYSVAVLMSDLSRLKMTGDVTIDINWNLGPTLGAWLVWLNSLVSYLYPRRDVAFMPEMLEILGPKEIVGTGYIELMFKFKDEVRDPELGHGYTKEERWYATLVSEYENVTQSLFGNFGFTSRYPLLVPEEVDFVEDNSDEYEYKVRLLMGSEARFPLEKLKSRSRLKRGEVYLHNSRGQLLSLHPFLTYGICKKCSLSRLYLLDKITPTQVEYNAFCNHRRTDRTSKSVLDSKFANLFTG